MCMCIRLCVCATWIQLCKCIHVCTYLFADEGVNPFNRLPTYLPACLPTYLPVCLSTYLLACLIVHLLVYLNIYLSICLPIYQPTYLPIYLSIYLFISLSLYSPSIYLYICLSINLSAYPYLNLRNSCTEFATDIISSYLSSLLIECSTCRSKLGWHGECDGAASSHT